MALARKQWNNILIAASVFMIAVLSFMDKQTEDIPSDTSALFDEHNKLAQLQLSGIWMSHSQGEWRCDESVLNCHQWTQAWANVQVSPIAPPPALNYKPQELLLAIEHSTEPQVWLLYSHEGLLKSPANNWYQVPPSLRKNLDPILSLEPK
ncbi:hypothetical protein [Shewanella sp. SR44-3]|uniref:hypothetical protein n=1 Tax=unclassified Shewanella TaxID=196818 RepID=UPI0015FB58A6|nr:hypothetical protein [Shewanella sp. SR44-3]MBB1268433.1 hypothetical protein [Shewanella sp. SR44-3]